MRGRGRETFSRALTSTTVLVSRAMRLSLIVFTTSCGVFGRDALKNENDISSTDRSKKAFFFLKKKYYFYPYLSLRLAVAVNCKKKYIMLPYLCRRLPVFHPMDFGLM